MGMTARKTWTNWKNWLGTYRRPVQRSHDFADYGTAFGLDMSLGAETVTTSTATNQNATQTAAAQGNQRPQDSR